MIIEREEQISRLHTRLADHTAYSDPQNVADLRGQLDHLRDDLKVLEDAWQNRIENL